MAKVWLFLFTALTLWAAPLTLTQSGYFSLSPHLQIYEDTSHSSSVDTLNASHFIPFDAEHFIVPKGESTYWFYLRLHNESALSEWILGAQWMWLHRVSFFVKRGTTIESMMSGEFVPFSQRLIASPETIVSLQLAPDEEVELFMRIDSLEIIPRFFVQDTMGYMAQSNTRMVSQGILVGIVVALILYNLILAINLRSSLYAKYVAYMFFMLLFIVGDNGLLFTYVRPEVAMLNGYDKILFVSTAMFFLLLFSSAFLQIKEHHIRLHYFMVGYGVVLVLLALRYVVFQGYEALGHINVALMGVSLIAIYALYVSHKRSYEPARLYAAGYATFILFAVLTLLNNMHIIDFPIGPKWGVAIGVAIEGLVFSYALYARLQFGEKERLRYEAQVKRKDSMLQLQSRMAGMGEMMGSITHQWKQPLSTIAAIVGNSEMSLKLGELSRQEAQECIDGINEQIGLMNQTSRDFLNYYKPDKEKKAFSISAVVAQAIKFTHTDFSTKNIRVVFLPKEEVRMMGYPNELNQVIINLLKNAKDVLVERVIPDPVIHIEVDEVEGEKIIRVEDNAGGIDEAIIDKIFEPFFTTKEATSGTGIGLHIAKQIVQESMQGTIEVSNSTYGARFTIRF